MLLHGTPIKTNNATMLIKHSTQTLTLHVLLVENRHKPANTIVAVDVPLQSKLDWLQLLVCVDECCDMSTCTCYLPCFTLPQISLPLYSVLLTLFQGRVVISAAVLQRYVHSSKWQARLLFQLLCCRGQCNYSSDKRKLVDEGTLDNFLLFTISGNLLGCVASAHWDGRRCLISALKSHSPSKPKRFKLASSTYSIRSAENIF